MNLKILIDRTRIALDSGASHSIGWGEVILPFVPVVGLFVSFPIPPIVDLMGHVALSLAPTGYEGQFYIHRFGVTYQTFDVILHLAQVVVGQNFGALCAFAMLLMIATLLVAPASFARLRGSCALVMAAILIGPAFLITHSQLFVWGIFPYILAAWLSPLAVFALLRADIELVANDRIGGYVVGGVALALLAAVTHPIGIVYTGIGMTWLIFRIMFVRAGWKRRVVIWGGLSLTLILVIVTASVLLKRAGSLSMLVGVEDLQARIKWLVEGGPYNTFMLVLSTDYFGPRWAWYRALLSLLPFICLAGEVALCTLRWKRGMLEPYSALLLALLFSACALVLVAPESFDELSWLPSRHMIFTHPLTLMVMADFILIWREHLRRFLLPAAVISLVAIGLYIAPYREAQDFQTVAAAAALNLEHSVEQARLKGELSQSPVLVSYIPSNMGRTAWFVMVQRK